MKIALLTLLCCCFFSSNGQVILSLDDDAALIANYEKKIGKMTGDSAKAIGYLQLSAYYRLVADTVKIKHYLALGKQLAGKNLFVNAAIPYYEATQLYTTGNIALIKGKLMEAEKKLAALKSTDAYRVRGFVWHAYSTFLQMEGKENEATKNFIGKALPYAKKSGNLLLIGNVNKSIGIGFMNANQRDLAATYLSKAFTNIEKSPSDNPIRLETLVETYIIAAENDAERKQLPKTKINIDKAYQLLKSHPTSNLYYKFDYVAGIYYCGLKEYDKSLQYFDSGITLALKDPNSAFTLNRLKRGRYKTLKLKKDYPKAAAQLEDLEKSPFLLQGDRQMNYKDLTEIYSLLGQDKQALKWSQKYIKLSDSLYGIKFQNDIVEMEKKYSTVENEKKIAKLSAEKKQHLLKLKNNQLTNWLLIGAIIFLLILASFIYFYYRNHKKLAIQREVNLQQKATDLEQKQQIELGKAMIEAEEEERNRLARDLHDGLGGMLAGVKLNLSSWATLRKNNLETQGSELQRIINQLDDSVNELRNISRNMMSQTLLNFGLEVALKELCESIMEHGIVVDFQPMKLSRNIKLPQQLSIYRIVQETLTNILKHAQASEIVLQCSQNQNRFYITAEDNGKGFDTKKLDLDSGMGLGNIKNRVEYLNGNLEILSTVDEGTIINIELDVA